MRFELLLTSILAIFSFVGALSYKDRSIIAQLKMSTEQTEKLVYLESLSRHIQVAEKALNDQDTSPFITDSLRIHIRNAKRYLDSESFNGNILEHLVDEFKNIVRTYVKYDPELPGRIIRMDKPILIAFEQAAERHIQNFLLATGPKVRELSAEAQESESELITAYNSVAHAGFVPIVDSFKKLSIILYTY